MKRENTFLKEIESLKGLQKTKQSPINLFVSDEFYAKAKSYLLQKYGRENNNNTPIELTKQELDIATRKKRKTNLNGEW